MKSQHRYRDFGGVTLDGTNEYIYDNTFFAFNQLNYDYTDAFTISFWYKPRVITLTDRGLLAKTDFIQFAGRKGWDIYRSGNSLFFRFWLNSATYLNCAAAGVFTAGSWYHIVATNDGSGTHTGMSLYMNGGPVTTTRSAAGVMASILVANSFTINIHASSAGGALANCGDGKYTEISAWNTEFTLADVKWLFGRKFSSDPATHPKVQYLQWWYPINDLCGAFIGVQYERSRSWYRPQDFLLHANTEITDYSMDRFA